MARLALMALAGWLNEESCILLYRFYNYSPEWTISIAHVPLLVVLIWPLVIHSAWDLVRQWQVRGRMGHFPGHGGCRADRCLSHGTGGCSSGTVVLE